MLLCDCIQDYFRRYLVLQRGYGTNTLASYRDTFKLLVAYLASRGLRVGELQMRELTGDTVADFLGWLESDRGNSASTRNVRLAHLRSFAGFVMTASPEDAGACASVSALPTKRVASGPPDSLSREETALLLAAPGTGTASGLRDSALLALLYDSACRVQELADLNVADVSTRPPCSVEVLGKGMKARRVPLLRETGALVGAYVSAFRLAPGGPLFSNRSGARLTRAGISNVVERHWRSVVALHPETAAHGAVKPHLLRHTKATHLVEEGVNIYYVRDFLGHASVETTQVYLKSNVERMRSAIEAASRSTVAPCSEFYTEEKREELERFLESLV